MGSVVRVQYLGRGEGIIRGAQSLAGMDYSVSASSLWGHTGILVRDTDTHRFVQFDDRSLGFWAYDSHGLPSEDCITLKEAEEKRE